MTDNNRDNTKRIRITLYSKERYEKTGNGAYVRSITTNGKTKDELDHMVELIKKENALANARYESRRGESKANMLSLEPVSDGSHIKPPLILDEGTGNTTAIFGSSKTGKTTLMMKLYENYYDPKLSLATLFALNPQIDLYKSQKHIIKCPYVNKNTANYVDWLRKINKDNQNKYNFLVMFDDFIEVRNNSVVNNLILTYRNSNISSIICLQYINLLNKMSRSNVNNVFLFRMNSDEAIEVAVRTYCTTIFNKQKISDHMGFYKDLTQDHHYIYIHPSTGQYYFSKYNKWF
jgi:putative ribosome biogenesis GTPase RsgA